MLTVGRVTNILHNPAKRGVHVATGDFCTVHSNPGCLYLFPDYRLKRDRSVLNQLAHDADGTSITNAAVMMKRRPVLDLIVEHVRVEAAPR